MRRINLFSYGMMSLLKLFARVLVIVLAVSLFQQAHSAQAVPVRPPHFDRRAMPEALAAPVRSPKGDAAKPAPDWRFYVLEYHNFTENASQAADYTMTVSALRRDLDFLRDNGYTTVLPRELAAGQLDDGSPLPQKAVLLTFDDGYEDNYTTMFPILKEKGAAATIFLITDLIGTPGYMTEAQIKEMAASGIVRFGCHTKSHNDLSSLNEEEVRSQLNVSADIIENMLGYEVKALAYPAGGFNDTVVRVAGERFAFAYTTKSPASYAADNMLTIPRYAVYRGYGASFITGTLS